MKGREYENLLKKAEVNDIILIEGNVCRVRDTEPSPEVGFEKRL